MYCSQMRPAGIQGKKNLISYTQKTTHKDNHEDKKKHEVSFFLHSNECGMTTSFCLYESKGLLHSEKERHFSFYT